MNIPIHVIQMLHTQAFAKDAAIDGYENDIQLKKRGNQI